VFGASAEGGIVVVDGTLSGCRLSEYGSMCLHGDALFLCDHWCGDIASGHARVIQWVPGANAGKIVAGQGADISGVNDLCANIRVAVCPAGELLVADIHHKRVLRFDDTSGQVLVNDLDHLLNISVSANGIVYILDQDGTRVQKLEGRTLTPVAGGNGEGPAPNQFGAYCFVALDDGSLFISDFSNHRVQRWSPGSVQGETVAGGNGRGPSSLQLSFPMGLAVTEQHELYIADAWNYRVVKWSSLSTSGVVVAGGTGEGHRPHQLGHALDLAIDEHGSLYVLDSTNNRVTRWGSAPALRID